ncbi:MAG TPA: maltose alpha-D-glucosyltransferase [Bryobacteraceae bacterium]|nr:maltose alpha-D-glucosyltransferase [Bryobacteraceae bacterium]HUO32239.1 maltose alpha-D-glucosyltransferase [Bryobacteraceae bacterium]
MANPQLKRAGSARNPLWYKDAVIYELHVKAFLDSNHDGIGDFPGLIQKLDYLQELGVTCLWLLPFFPSPLRDDGYDISDYLSIHPAYGTMQDFETFLAAAHERGMQVMVELVVNHTSDQHPWFQAARRAPAGSPERDFYVWSDNDQKYANARIIFTDTEKSNWTWDPVAQAYYWHRFFSHQPDLNYDNPVVLEEVLGIMRFWLDLGVDGLRLDAIPYLVEREGTNCENLPETHAILKKIRAAMDAGYEDRIILAEANQWPTDVRAYFADGDECHMAFHFPLMPRMFMALRLEDRLPIAEIMGQTPEIPETCQWGLFLRNHDELTLEMVNDEERDYMYLAYSADPRMRINVGIRRRLAPLMENNRRRVELLNSLLFSFPGTPILYYGDEIGMGDNIYLGDRNGVRTPMQWTADRNGGFSRANPARLYSPVVMDPVYGYDAVNVEAQQGDPSSLWSWMRNLIALRKLFRVFGRGSIEFLYPVNRKILAYVRRNQGEQVLCVANLSRFAQPVELNLQQFEGMRPVEMLGYVEFPLIGKQPYPLTLGPYGFLWFELQPTPEQAEILADESLSAYATVTILGGWKPVLEGPQWTTLERVLPEYLQKQRWFSGQPRRIRETLRIDWAEVAGAGSVLLLVEADYEDQGSDLCQLCLAAGFASAAGAIRSTAPAAILCGAVSAEDDGVLYDALLDDQTCLALLAAIGEGREISSAKGSIRGVPAGWFARLHAAESLVPHRIPDEQRNSSIVFGDRLILKLFRRLEPGPNPDCEISRFLTEKTDFNRIPPFAGLMEYIRPGAEPVTLAMLQGFVANEGDGWKWHQEELARYYEQHARLPFDAEVKLPAARSCFEVSESEPGALAREHLGIGLDSAAILGRRTAELHLALASAKDDPAFAPEPLSEDRLRALAADLRAHAIRVLDLLKDNLPRLSDDLVEQGGLLLGRRRELLQSFHFLGELEHGGLRTRVHGDYHLGQVLRVKQDYVILDFEGEPAYPLAERRAKQSPLKDVAGMLRSFSYAAQAGLASYAARHPDDLDRLAPWAQLWEISTMAEFLRAYRAAAAGALFLPARREDFRALLEAYLLDQALYQLAYELENRPAWIKIPAIGILSILP